MKQTDLFIDFETYFDADYSLKKMPTWQYLRDERFQLLGAVLAAPGYIEPQWLDNEADIRAALAGLPWGEGVRLVAHNAAFDASVLARVFPGYIPRRYYCTMLGRRYLISQGVLPPHAGTALDPDKGNATAEAVAAGGEALRDYAINDLRLLLQHFSQQTDVPEFEKDLIHQHVKMAAEPVLALDADSLRREANKEPPPEVVALRKKSTFIAALAACGVEPEYKTSPRTGKQTEAFAKTDSFMQRLATHHDPRVRALHKLRTEGGSNIDRTRSQRLLDVGAPMPVPLLYYGAHTGRASGQDKLNLQNLKRGGVIRRALQAPPGYKLIIVDSAQIEVRVLAWLAGEDNLLNVFHEGRDVYVDYGANVLFRKPHAEIDTEERRLSKPPVLAAGFGQGWAGLVRYAGGMGVQMSDGMAQRAVEGYRTAYPRVVRHWDEVMRDIERHQQTRLPSGRLLTYPDLTRKGRDLYFLRHSIFSKQRVGVRDEIKLWHGLAVENEVQAAARDVVMWQTLQLAKRYRVVLSVHDEAVVCVPEAHAESAHKYALECFSMVPDWAQGLPVEGEAVISQDYGAKP